MFCEGIIKYSQDKQANGNSGELLQCIVFPSLTPTLCGCRLLNHGKLQAAQSDFPSITNPPCGIYVCFDLRHIMLNLIIIASLCQLSKDSVVKKLEGNQ